MSNFPELPRHCGSWVIIERQTGALVCETFDRESAIFAALSDTYAVHTVVDYLGYYNFALQLNAA